MTGFSSMVAFAFLTSLLFGQSLFGNSGHDEDKCPPLSPRLEANEQEGLSAGLEGAAGFHSGLKLSLKRGADPLPEGLSYSLNAPSKQSNPIDKNDEALTPGLYELSIQQKGLEVFHKRIVAIEDQTSLVEISYDKTKGFSLRQTLELPQIKFVAGQRKIAPPSLSDLNKLVQLLRADVGIERFGFEVHTDAHGDARVNQALTEARAVEVKNYLVKKGVDAHLIKASGLGATHPVASNDSQEGRLLNRRVEFVIIETSVEPKLLGDR